MKTKQLSRPALVLPLVLSLSFACGEAKYENESIVPTEVDGPYIELSTAQFETMKMQWGSLDSGQFSESITVQGSIQVPVESMQEVSTFYGGYVSGMELLEGQEVRRGQVLFSLENPDFILLQQDYLETKSQLAYLQSEYERQKTLYSEQISSQKSYLKAEADYQGTRAKAESLKRQLQLLNINADELKPETMRSKIPVYSPISGFVTKINAVPGIFIQPTDIAVSLISKEHLHMELMVFERDATVIKKGQQVKVRIPEISSEVMMAEVFMVGQSINEARQINVHAHLKDKSKESLLVPGMFLEAEIQKDSKAGWAIEQSAVLESEGETVVLVLREKTAGSYRLERVKVVTGQKEGDRIEILSMETISPQDEILIKGGFNLL